MENQTNSTGVKSEFVCDKPCCADGRRVMNIGKATATALSGFIAGVIVAVVVLLPWLVVLGKLCPSKSY